MENYQVGMLMSVFVLLGAVYEHTVNKNIDQIKDELLQNGNEIMKGKEGLKSTYKAFVQVKVENELVRKELTQVKVELDTTKKEVKQVKVGLESTTNEVKQVKVELESTKRELKQVQVELENIKTELHTQRPGFYVTLSAHTLLHQTQKIEFDLVKTDVTNNYNRITGIFTVPKDGLYHFSFTMLSSKDRLHAEIVHNQQVIGRNVGTAIFVSATINAVISCKQGDLVFVRHLAGEGTETITGAGYSAFSGFLID